MKTTIKYAGLLLLYWASSGCAPQTTAFDVDMRIVSDITDSMMAYPTAGQIIPQLGLKDSPWRGIRITTTFISDRDINDVQVLTLDAENQWTGNLTLRKARIRHFEMQLQQCLSATKYTAPRPYSVIYRTVARQANGLATSAATKRYLLIYSDLAENSADANFYNPRTIARLQKTPESVARQLEAAAPLNALKGLDMWLLYDPASFRQNNNYMAIAGFYRHLLQEHGARVHIDNKFMPQ